MSIHARVLLYGVPAALLVSAVMSGEDAATLVFAIKTLFQISGYALLLAVGLAGWLGGGPGPQTSSSISRAQSSSGAPSALRRRRPI